MIAAVLVILFALLLAFFYFDMQANVESIQQAHLTHCRKTDGVTCKPNFYDVNYLNGPFTDEDLA